MSKTPMSFRFILGFLTWQILVASAVEAYAQQNSLDVDIVAETLNRDAKERDDETSKWVGVYASPREVESSFSSVLVMSRGMEGIDYRRYVDSDFETEDGSPMVFQGTCLIENSSIYIPEAHSFDQRGKIVCFASVEKYYLHKVGGTVALLRRDAYEALKANSDVPIHGILIRVSDHLRNPVNPQSVPHPSLSQLLKKNQNERSIPGVGGLLSPK